MDPALDQPLPKLPEAKDSLYVIKAIGKYEPYMLSDPANFNPDQEKTIFAKLYKDP